jgi:ElaB/YqjD/DUF883 family membrane-anchored ribosome-binding protein
MSTASERLGNQADKVKHDLEEMGANLKDAAQEKVGQVGQQAADYCQQGRERVHGVACACEQYVRERPLRCVLVAAGIGWLAGRFWKRG